MTVVDGLEFIFGHFLPALLNRWDNWMITPEVSVLGFSVAVVILVVIIGAVLLRV